MKLAVAAVQTTGSMTSTVEDKRRLAASSLEFNTKNVMSVPRPQDCVFAVQRTFTPIEVDKSPPAVLLTYRFRKLFPDLCEQFKLWQQQEKQQQDERSVVSHCTLCFSLRVFAL